MSDEQAPPARRRRDPFGVDHLDADLKGRTVRGSVAVLGSQWVSHLVNVGAIAVLARLVTPDEFGLVAMVSAVVGFVAMFRDAGLSMATVQRRSINHEQTSSLFWVNLLVSLVLALVIAAMSPGVAWFYEEPRLTLVTAGLGAGFFASGLGVQHRALLRRQMRFRDLAVIEVAAQVAGQAAAIAGALAGMSYWALVLRSVVTPLAISVGCWIAMPWRPGLPRRGVGVRDMLAFGGYLTGFNVVNYLGRNGDNVIIGKFVGSEGLGIYSKAYSLLLLPIRTINRPVTAATVPALARLQDDPARLTSFYYKGVALTALLSMPVVTAAAATADSVVLTVLGRQWLPAVEIFRILTAAAFVGTTNVVTGWAYLALGNVRRQLWSGVANTAVGLLGFGIGVRWGVEGVAWAVVISALVRRVPTIMVCYHGTPFTMGALGRALWRPALASIAAGVVTYYFHAEVAAVMAPPLALVASAPVFLACYLVVVLVSPGGKEELARAVSLVRSLRRPRKVEVAA